MGLYVKHDLTPRLYVRIGERYLDPGRSSAAMATFTAISQQQAQAFVTEFDLGRCLAVTPIPAGSVNSNFVLDVENEGARTRYFVRVFEEQGVEGARYDAALLAHLSKRGVPT